MKLRRKQPKKRKKPAKTPVESMDISSMLKTVPIPSKVSKASELEKIEEI